MRIDVITLFPEFIQAAMAVGVVGRAQQRGLLDVQCWNPRDFATDNHRSVDGRVCGGGPGMVMTIDPLCAALDAVRTAAGPGRVVYPNPQGRRLTQGKVVEFAACEHLILLCGRYEGVDERLLASRVDEEVSIGDYVLSGGELAAAVIIDAVGRLQDGALNDAQSAQQDSFSDGLLDCPHYAKPVQHDLGSVPAVLLSGNHAAIGRWRRKQSLGRTWLRRPDLLARVELDAPSRQLLEEFRREVDAATGLSEAVKDRPDQTKTKANR